MEQGIAYIFLAVATCLILSMFACEACLVNVFILWLTGEVQDVLVGYVWDGSCGLGSIDFADFLAWPGHGAAQPIFLMSPHSFQIFDFPNCHRM